MVCLHKEGLAGSSEKSYLAALWYPQIAIGLGDPKMAEGPRLSYVTRGFKKLSAEKQRPRLLITPSILRQLKVVWEATEDTLMAACCRQQHVRIFFLGFLEQERW